MMQTTQGIDDANPRPEYRQMIDSLHPLRLLPTVPLMAMLFACAGRSQSTPSAPPPARTAPAANASSPPAADNPRSPSWLQVDSATRTVTLTLEVTARAGAPSALINGYRAGAARIIIPLGWTVKWNWRNADSASPHSLVVMVQREKVPLEGGRPAFSNAMTRMVTEGLPAVQSDQTTFEAEEPGWYWLLCGVPTHAVNGEWLELRVDPDAKTASVEVKKREE
jgi:hypothetical protein